MCLPQVIYTDNLSKKKSIINLLDPRAKLIVTLFYICIVMSFHKYQISMLIPFFAFPILLIILSDINILNFLKRLAFISLFALTIAIWNPFIDKTPVLTIGNIVITGGYLSFTSILIRFILTASTALILLNTTGIRSIYIAFQKLGLPQVMVVQLFFLNHYIFVLVDEATRMQRARLARSFGRRGLDIKNCTKILASFLLRSIDRSQRIYIAMKSRGFNGEINNIETLHWRIVDWAYLLLSILFFLILRFCNINEFIGNFFIGSI